ncbi:molybdopterin-dependent oxidoreductase [Nocardia sp. NPDC019395]|uniref:molybdopterin-containing oxidoreductase family protein n=1 Tax=Nocardia sp. NPDC019395 TaxID=3154686 RepID=UPI0033DD8A80
MNGLHSNLPAAPGHIHDAGNPQHRGPLRSQATYCRICEACCGLIADVRGDRLIRVHPDDAHPHSRGFSCGKPQGLVELTYDPDRITTPMVRNGPPGSFVPVTWDEALDRCAERLSAIRDEFGPEAIAHLRGNPPYFESGGFLWATGFSAALGITTSYTVNAEDGASRLAANEALYGDISRFPRPDLWRTNLAMIIGANPLDARSTRVSEPRIRDAFDSVVARGGRVLVVDPRRTRTAQRYEHISIRPGTDPWFLVALCKTILELSDQRAHAELARTFAGFDEFAALMAAFDIDDCAEHCGIEPTTVLDVAQEFLRSESAIVYGGTGTCVQRFGTLTNILLDSVLAITGNVDRVGGVLAGWAAIDLAPGRPGPKTGIKRSRVEGRPEVGGGLPSAALAADISTPGPGKIRALVMRGCNTVLASGGGGERLENALEQLDFSLAIDLYVNETNRYADVFLPVTAMYERDDYPVTTGDLQLRPTAYATRAVIEPVGLARDAWWIFDEISRRMGLGGSCPDKELEQLAEARGSRPTPTDLINRLLEKGPGAGLTFETLVEEFPHGVTLRETLPAGRLTADLPTPDGRVRLNSEQLRSEIGRMRSYHDSDETWPLRMIGRREKGSQNTWMHNSARLYPDDYRFVAFVHPRDAEVSQVRDGETVRLVSAVGSIEVPIKVVDAIRQGVVSVPNGWGHRGGSWHRSNRFAGANTNDLVDHTDVEAIAGMSIINGVPIRMEPLEKPGSATGHGDQQAR